MHSYSEQVSANGYLKFGANLCLNNDLDCNDYGSGSGSRSNYNYNYDYYYYSYYQDYTVGLNHIPSLFPNELRSAVAPFWADVDITNRAGVGAVRFEVHEDAFASDFLAEVSNFITEETGSSFMGQWMLLVEWSGVPAFHQSFDLVCQSAISVRTYVRMYVCMYVCVCVCVCMYACMHVCVCVCVHTYVLSSKNAATCIWLPLHLICTYCLSRRGD